MIDLWVETWSIRTFKLVIERNSDVMTVIVLTKRTQDLSHQTSR